MPVPIWAGRYIGLPFKGHGRDRSGLDCWGLARLVLAEQFSIALPSFATDYRRTSSASEIEKLIRREVPKWKAASHEKAVAGDVVILRMRGSPMHVGIVLGDGHMLHIEQGTNSAIEKYTGVRWKDRLFGFYRYNPLPADEDEDEQDHDIFGYEHGYD